MINFTEYARVNFSFHGLRHARKTEVLGGHEHFAAGIPRRNHIADEIGIRREGFFAQDMLARLQGRNRQRRMIIIGGTNINNVDARIIE